MEKEEKAPMIIEYRPATDKRQAVVVTREPGKKDVKTIVEVVPPRKEETHEIEEIVIIWQRRDGLVRQSVYVPFQTMIGASKLYEELTNKVIEQEKE